MGSMKRGIRETGAIIGLRRMLFLISRTCGMFQETSMIADR
jgi:hypothetical protein